jgi:hypothetical protein
MPDKPFVINDRRKFTAEGELRPDAAREDSPAPQAPEPSSPAAATTEPADTESAASKGPRLVADAPPEPAPSEPEPSEADDRLPPPPSAEQTAQATRAYDATVDRLETAIRATNPGMDRMPEMNFERLVQSLYMQSLLQLGGTADPGQSPQVDLLGARQTIDMLAVIEDKTHGNLSDSEEKLLQSALFEARMGFLEVTQALARSAASRQGASGPGPNGGPGGGGPSIVR